MSIRWKKYHTLYVTFTLGNFKFKIKEVTRNIAEDYVSTFVIFKGFFLKKEGEIYQMLHFRFSYIMDSCFHIVLFIDKG